MAGRSARLSGLILLALAVANGCGDATPIDGADAADPRDSVDATATHDVPTDADAEPIPEEFILGTNVTGANDPTSFTALADGDSLHIELGFQGLWMVVLAFKTRGIFTGDLLLDAEIVVDGEQQGTLALAGQRLANGGDGYGYYYNFFLVVQDPSVSGRPATIHVLARDAVEREHRAVLEVNLTGGT